MWSAVDGVLLHTLEGHTALVMSVAVSPDGWTIVSGSDDKTVRVWSLADGSLLRTRYGHDSPVNSVAVFPGGGRIVSGSNDHTVLLWRAAGGAYWWNWLSHCEKSVFLGSPTSSAAMEPVGTAGWSPIG